MPLADPLAFPLGGPLGIDDLTPAERDAFDLILSLWPPGAWHELYDVDNPRADIRLFFGVVAQALAGSATTPLANLRVEVNPATAVERLPDWEAALGLPATRRPPDTTAGRQAAVVSKLREFGSYSLPEIRAIVGPLLGYADPTVLLVVETNRAALRALHPYAGTGAVHVTAATSPVAQAAIVADDGVVSVGGVRVRLNGFAVAGGALDGSVSVRLDGPDGTLKVWTQPELQASASPLTLRTTAFNGKPIIGTWTLRIFTGVNDIDATSWDLFVEGARLDSSRNDGRGAEVFYFGCYADATLEGAAAPSDRDAARRVLQRIRPAHTRSTVLATLAPRPASAIAIDSLMTASFVHTCASSESSMIPRPRPYPLSSHERYS